MSGGPTAYLTAFDICEPSKFSICKPPPSNLAIPGDPLYPHIFVTGAWSEQWFRFGPFSDLVVVNIAVSPSFWSGDRILAPASVTVKNKGSLRAGIFKMSVEQGGLLVPFSPSSTDWYAYSNSPLEPGEERRFEGFLSFRADQRWRTVSVAATVDSCSGEEFTRAYCRDPETNEGNNRSAPVSVFLNPF